MQCKAINSDEPSDVPGTLMKQILDILKQPGAN